MLRQLAFFHCFAALISVVLIAGIYGCQSGPGERPPVPIEEQLANARRLFLSPGQAPPVAERNGQPVYQSPLEVRMTCVDKLVLELPPRDAFDDLSRLLQRLDSARSNPQHNIGPLIQYTGQRLLNDFIDDDELIEHAFQSFRRQTSANAKHLSWLLVSTAADSGYYDLDADAVISTYREIDDDALRFLILDNIGLCHDPEPVLEFLRRKLYTTRENLEFRYPGLVVAHRGYRSVLRVEASTRLALQQGRLPENHLVRTLYESADAVPDSRDELVPIVFQLGLEPSLKQRDMFLICTFLRNWDPKALQELSNRLIRYDKSEVRHELHKFAEPERRPRTERRRRSQGSPR